MEAAGKVSGFFPLPPNSLEEPIHARSRQNLVLLEKENGRDSVDGPVPSRGVTNLLLPGFALSVQFCSHRGRVPLFL